MLQNVIEVSNLSKRFPLRKSYWELIRHPLRKKEFTALRDISLTVSKGELFGLLGPNGAGKTTLVKILCTLILPNEGTVFVNNMNLMKDSRGIRKKIGYVISEERSFYWRLTGRENLDFFSTLNGVTGKEAKKKIESILDVVKMTEDADRMFKDYSTGMRQKLAIARGLLSSPEILFMDEPTKSLDPAMAKRIRRFIKDELISNGITVFLCTHNVQEALMCDRIGVLNRSRLLACGTVEELGMEKTRKEYNLVSSASSELREKLPDIIRGFPAVSNVRALKKQKNQRGTSYSELKSTELEFRVSFEAESEIWPFMQYITKQNIPVTAFYPVEKSLEDVVEEILEAKCDS